MSGPSSGQIQLSNEQIQFYNQATSEAEQAFREQQGLLAQLNSIYSPILKRGPNQEGFSAAEKSDLEAQAVQGTAGNYARAARAVGETVAAEGGGENPLPSGSATQLREEVATSAAAEQSREQSQIEEADYAQGYREFEDATGAIERTSELLSPNSYNDAAIGAGSSAEQTQKDIVSEENAWMAPVFGAIGAVGGGLLGNENLFGGSDNSAPPPHG